MTQIRRYESGDADAVRRLHERALRDTGTDPTDVPGVDDLAAIEPHYLDTGGTFLVVEDAQERIVGMGGLQVEGDEGELFRMRVDPDCQREGVGADLLGALEDAARERGVERLEAETATRQEAAMQFYPSHGYERVDERSFADYDLVTFAKRLD
ncbi:GNAT family N-acetyltransferase [Halobacteriales archaeon Cl-PHB]